MTGDRRTRSSRGGIQKWAGLLAAAGLVVGLAIYFVAVGADRADALGSPIGAVIGLAALMISIPPLKERYVVARNRGNAEGAPGTKEEPAGEPPSRKSGHSDVEAVTGFSPVRSRFGFKVNFKYVNNSQMLAVVVAVVAVAAILIAFLYVSSRTTGTPSALSILPQGVVPTPTPTPTPISGSVGPSSNPADPPTTHLAPPGTRAPSAARSGEPSVLPTTPSPAATTPRDTASSQPVTAATPRSRLILANGAEYISLIGDKAMLVGKTDGPDVEVETTQVDPLGRGAVPTNGDKACRSPAWSDQGGQTFDIMKKPSFCVRSHLGDVYLLELAPSIDTPQRPRPYVATITRLPHS